jgi:hypothetical protein
MLSLFLKSAVVVSQPEHCFGKTPGSFPETVFRKIPWRTPRKTPRKSPGKIRWLDRQG